MVELIKKLQEEVGISEEQAIKAISIIKGEIEDGDFKVDWDKVMKNKYEFFLAKAKEAMGDASKEANKLAGTLSEKADDIADSAREKLRDLSQKAADYFDDKNKKA